MDTHKKIEQGKPKPLSQAGRLIMIKSVLLALPIYLMSCYKFPKKLNCKLQQLISSFWKIKSPDYRSLTWDSWSSICQSKDRGGLGFRQLDAFNQALLAKHGRKFLTNPESICAQIMKAKY